MAFTLKPAVLEKATDPAKIQKVMKADLKSTSGKKNVKFLVAKNCLIGTKTISLFIVTDNPAGFEKVIKAKFPKALRAKGVCDVLPGQARGTTQVTIKTSAGQISPDAIAKLVRPAVGSESSILASAAPPKTSDQGVAQWAKNAYMREAKRTLIASMTKDGKIGSVYFKDGSRIRTTHGAGPSQEKHEDLVTVQFNVDNDKAEAEFKKLRNKTLNSQEDWNEFDRWLAEELNQAKRDQLPSWAILVSSPGKAHDLSQGKPTGDLALFEIFKSINGELEGWHPSRGTATRFKTDKQTIAVLQAAIVHIKGVKGAKARNVAFYNFVKSRLPKFVPFMRDPSEV